MALDIGTLRQKIIEFRDHRDWKQFHSLKNLVPALCVEASELLELTQWKTADELKNAPNDAVILSEFKREIADVLIYLLLICDNLAIDPLKAAEEKLKENEQKYPIWKSKGSAKKYSEL
jgi:NTP pyrophosphatase (non-canonical NTP hydrolase)